MANHPYHPVGLKLPLKYAPPALGVEMILGVFFAVCGLSIFSIWSISGERPGFLRDWQRAPEPRLTSGTLDSPGSRKYLKTHERMLACWFFCSGLIHLIVEGAPYFRPFLWAPPPNGRAPEPSK